MRVETGRGIYIFLVVGVLGLLGALFCVPALAQGGEFTSATAIKIPAANTSGKASPYPSGLTVRGLEGEISDVNVTLRGVSHENPDDLDILLVSPGGANVLLMADSGGGSDITGLNLTFDDEATDSLPDRTLISPGSYKPTKNGTAQDAFPTPAPTGGTFGKTLSVFDGSNPNGEWKLYVVDDESSHVGEIAGGYSLSIETTGKEVEANRPPVIDEVTVGSAREGVPVKVTVSATDPDGNSLTYSFDCDGDGNYEIEGQDSNSTECRYGEPGAKTVGVLVSDGTGSDSETIRFTVENVKPEISAVENFSTNEDTPSKKAEFTVTDAGEVTVTAVSGDQRLIRNENIELRQNADGGYEISATPEADENGEAGITITADDGTSTATEGFTLSVVAVNDAPSLTLAGDEETAEDSGAQTVEDFVTGASPGPENESDQRVTVGVAGSTNAALFTEDGRPAIDGDGTLTYTPKPNANGEAEVSVSVTDDGGTENGGEDSGEIRTFTITVNAVNDAPRASDGSLTTDEDTPESVNVFGGDAPLASDPEVERGEEGANIEVSSVTQGEKGAVEVGSAGVITYVPNADANGSDSFTYTVRDDGGETATGKVSVTINPADDAPAATDDSAETTEDTPVNIDVLANDADSDGGDELTISEFTQPSDGGGTVTKNSDGTLKFTPKSDFSGESTFTYTVTDGTTGKTATVTVTVTAVNDAPVAVGDTYAIDEDGTLTANGQGDNPKGVLENDTDADGDSLTAKLIGNVENGTLVFNATDGTFTYTPNADFFGTDEFTYTANDGTKDSATATVGIRIKPVNDRPVPTDDTKSTPENTPLVFPASDLTKNDSAGSGENDQKLTVTAVGNAENGTVALSEGEITYTPNTNFDGEDSFTYMVCDDGEEPLCSEMEATVTVTVGAVNSAPVAKDAALSTDEDEALSVDLAELVADDETASKDLTYAVVSGPGAGKGTTTINGSTLIYTPKKDFSGIVEVSYSATDNGDGDSPAKSDEGKLTITVSPVNDAPTADDDAASTTEDTPVTIDVLDGDTDPEGDALTISLVTQPGKGRAEVSGGRVVYTPNADTGGTDTFTYRVSDGEADSNIATVSVEVAAANDAPVARPDSAKTKENTPLNIRVLANDTDTDGDRLSAAGISQPANGRVTARANGTLRYTPNANWSGTDTFTYSASDGEAMSDPVSVTVSVTAVNDAPIAVDDVVKTPVNTPVRVAPLSNDTDIEGDTLSLTSVRFFERGAVRVENGTFLFTPARDFTGVIKVTYRISDGRGGQDTGVVTIRVGKKVS